MIPVRGSHYQRHFKYEHCPNQLSPILNIQRIREDQCVHINRGNEGGSEQGEAIRNAKQWNKVHLTVDP